MLRYNFHYIPRSKNYTNFNQLKSLRFRLKVILKSFLPLSLSAIRQFQGGIISPLVVAKRSCLITDRKVQAHVSLVYTQNFQNVLSSYPSTTTPPANNAIGGGGGSSLSLSVHRFDRWSPMTSSFIPWRVCIPDKLIGIQPNALLVFAQAKRRVPYVAFIITRRCISPSAHAGRGYIGSPPVRTGSPFTRPPTPERSAQNRSGNGQTIMGNGNVIRCSSRVTRTGNISVSRDDRWDNRFSGSSLWIFFVRIFKGFIRFSFSFRGRDVDCCMILDSK